LPGKSENAHSRRWLYQIPQIIQSTTLSTKKLFEMKNYNNLTRLMLTILMGFLLFCAYSSLTSCGASTSGHLKRNELKVQHVQDSLKLQAETMVKWNINTRQMVKARKISADSFMNELNGDIVAKYAHPIRKVGDTFRLGQVMKFVILEVYPNTLTINEP
jgi:hypothetical protein